MVRRPNTVGRNALGDRATWSARRTPDKLAFISVETGRTVTFSEFNDRANKAAHAFLSTGLTKGDHVGFVTTNSERMLAAEFGALKAGLVPAMNNTQLDTDTMRYQLENADAKAVVVDRSLYPLVETYVVDSSLDTVVCIDGTPDENGAPVAFDSFIEGAPATEPDVTIEGSDPAFIMFTSGTTSRPKGVLHTHESYAYNTANVAIKHNIQIDDVIGTIHPLFHIVETWPRAGFELSATNVIFRGFDPKQFLQAIEEYNLTTFYLMSSIYRRLLNEADITEYDLSSVRLCGYGMPMEMSLRERVVEGFDAELQLGMGQTEAGVLMFLDHDWQFEKEGNYIGQTGPYGDVAIMDDDGNLLPQGEYGEIVFRSPAIMGGYINNEEKTREVWSDGWHRTGDIGKIDEDGLVLFVDRKKDVIKTGGENVSTTKVQNAVSDHPAVDEAAVVGLPHKEWTEAVTAFVVLSEDTDASEQDIVSFLRDRLARFEIPKEMVFVDELPQTATGKIRKVELRDEYDTLYT